MNGASRSQDCVLGYYQMPLRGKNRYVSLWVCEFVLNQIPHLPSTILSIHPSTHPSFHPPFHPVLLIPPQPPVNRNAIGGDAEHHRDGGPDAFGGELAQNDAQGKGMEPVIALEADVPLNS